MSLTFKLLSLAIRTAAKPIGNYIKRQAKEHDGFRRFAVNQAQRVHRIDMRMRLGILHDPDAQQRMHEREQKAAEEKKRREETPTVRSAEEQKKHDEQKAKEAQGKAEGKAAEEKPHKIKIRPLSEARAIELGANFFSEAFIFAVAAGLLVWDSWRSRKKELARRDDVADRLEQLESDVQSLRTRLDPDLETLHDLSERIREAKRRQSGSWWNPLNWGRGPEDTAVTEEGHDSREVVKMEKDEAVEPASNANADAKKIGQSRTAHRGATAPELGKKAVDHAGDKNVDTKDASVPGKAPERVETRVDVVAASNKSR